MAKTRTPKDDDEEKIVKENIQKRFKNFFTGKGEPLSNMSIQEVEALKSRVAELEAELAQSPAESREKKPLGVSPAEPARAAIGVDRPLLGKSTRQDQSANTDEEPFDGNKKPFVNLILDFFQLPEDEDPSFIRIVRSILMFTLVANIGVLFLTLGVVNDRVRIPTIVTLSILLILVVISLFLSYRKKLLPAKIIVPLALIISITYIAQGANGLHDSAIAGYGLTIIIASLILGSRGTLLVSGLAVLGVLYLGYSDITGITESFMAAKTGYDDILIIAVLLVTSGGMLRLLVERFSETTLQAIAANKQLQALQIGLEQRVADRTHDLELATEVGQTVSAKVDNLYQLLSEAAELIRTRFELYYTQIYLVDPLGKNLTLYAGTGEVGKQLLQTGHHLPIDSRSLNGRAAIEKHAAIVTDTANDATFRPNRLLPKTRSEMSIPLIVSGKVVGVLDMQSEEPGALNETNLPAFEALASQLAIAIQNASLFTQAQEARAAVEAQIRHLTEQGWQDFLDAIDRGQKIGYEFKKSQIVRLEPDALLTSSEDQDFNIPITVTGTKIGEIHLPVEQDHTWTPNELELIKVTSAQLAQHIENLRLLAQAERYRTEAEQAISRLTREGWDNYQSLHADETPGYVFNLVNVEPLTANSNGHAPTALKQPLSIRGETIGELAVDGSDHQAEASEIITAVAEQLSGHIENLRLSELNERHAQREHTLRQITSALRSSNNPATIMRTAVRELGSIMGRRTIVQLASPQRADQPESTASNENGSGAPALQS